MKKSLIPLSSLIGLSISLLILLTASVVSDDPEFKRVTAQWTDAPPKIDGRLNDKSWETATVINDLVQHQPTPGAPTNLKTNIYLLYDKNRLYVGFECFKTDMDQMMANETRRDSRFFIDDYVAIYLDTYLDRRNCYGFELNALGTQTDRRVQNEGANSGRRGSDMAWDCDWNGQSVREKDKWTAEFSIPFAELRFPQEEDQAWGINFWRQDRSSREELSWVNLGGREYAVSRYGHLVDLDITRLNTRRPIKLKPYATVRPQQMEGQDVHTKPAAGIDFRYPLSNLAFDLTFNPDFAQIEADPDMVNLTDIPLRFPEKRPFFQEGNEIFQAPIELFYSRRVEDLKGGAKMAGKIGNFNTALVFAQAGPEDTSREEKADILPPLDDYRYSVFRLQREFGQTATIGFLGTTKDQVTSGLNEHYDRSSGIDARFVLPQDLELNLAYASEWKTTQEWIEKGINRDQAIFAELSREASLFSWHSSFKARYFDIGQHFAPETGFVPRIDRRGVSLLGKIEKRRKATINFLNHETQYERLYNHHGKLANHRFRLQNIIGFSDFFLFFSPEWYYRLDDDDQAFTDRTLDLFLGWIPPKWISIRVRNSIGIRNDKESFFLGPEVFLRPTSKLNFEFRQQRLVEDSQLIDNTRRFVANYQFAQRMYLRSSLEQTLQNESRFFALFAYEYQPESNFFIVYNYNQKKKGKEQILFVKLVYLIKLLG